MVQLAMWALIGVLWHPFHVSLAQAQWNEDGSRMQIALRLTPRDLDAALSKASGRRIVLEKASARRAEQLVGGYLRERIYFAEDRQQAENDRPQARQRRRDGFHWVGIEQEIRYTWVYFELDCPRGVESVWLANRIFMEVEPTQINTFQLAKTSPVISLQTTREEPVKKLDLGSTRRPPAPR
jgi:hypothetical protein